jgi:CheY-like chemotaxis protein
MKILVVDDSASMRTLLGSLLASHGHDVVASLEDGSRLLDVVRAARPELICLDYELPGRDGLQLLAEINANAPGIDVVMMTSSTDPGVRHRAADAGAAGFIAKPFGQGQIIDELAQVAAMRARARASAPDAGATGAGTSAEACGSAAARRQPATAVVADDNGSIRMLLQGLLTNIGFTVVETAANGAEAVAAVRAHRPGVVCLDIDMPVMSGMDALPRIREESPLTGVVMVTANATREFVERAVTQGARGYIVKPLRQASIERVMTRLLS